MTPHIRRSRLAGALAALAVTSALASDVKCGIDNSDAYFTGNTRTDAVTGKLLKEYKCLLGGYVFWVVG